MTHRAVRVLVGALVLAAAMVAPLVGVEAQKAVAQTSSPVRILILGDSVTQGSVGDWTWRYRLWQHFADAGVAVDFVGPSRDLFDRSTNTYVPDGYLDPDFDQDHAARWGNALGFPAFSVDDLV